MNPYVPPGSDPNITSDEINAEENKKLKDFRVKIAEENQKYVEQHPEMRPLLDDFVTSLFVNKPKDLVKYAYEYFTKIQLANHPVGPIPIIIAGPSGVGKGTLIQKLLQEYPDAFGFSVSHTTRGPRPGEENGVHYNFVSVEEFEDAVNRHEFVEHAKVHTNYYGTSFRAIERVQSLNKICILDIDVQGVQTVKKSGLKCHYIFIAPPSLTELEHRLRGRNTETAEKIKVRLENAAAEIAYSQEPGSFDAVIVNDEVEPAYERLLRKLQEFYPSVKLDHEHK